MSCTKRPPPYLLGYKWELLTDVVRVSGLIPEIVLRHLSSGTRVVLKNVPYDIWWMIEAKCRLNSPFSMNGILPEDVFIQRFLGQKEDYLLLVLEYSGKEN